MTQIRNNQPPQPQNAAAETRPEQREAGENAAREFSRAMKKDGQSAQDRAAQDRAAQETPHNGAEKAFSKASADAASASANRPSGGVAGRRDGESGDAASGAARSPGQGAGQATAQAAGQAADQTAGQAASRDGSMLQSSAFSLNRSGVKKDAASGPDLSAPREEPTAPRGDAILAGMGQQTAGVQAGGPAGQAAGPSAVEAPRIDADMTSKLADRILVSASDATGNAEVRISLREDVLPGTEIRIQRQPDGGVNVQFVTGDARAEQMLGSRQLGDLQTALAQNLQVDVRVTTVRTDGSMSAEAGSGGQQGDDQGQGQGRGSRGGEDGQPRDGRSRQHDIFDTLRDERA